MITEDYCSYEVAKLLKDKGFDGLCYCHEFTDYEGNFTTYHTEYPENWNQSEPCVSIPTLGMAMAWLREAHKLHIGIVRGPSGYHITIETIPFGVVKYITREIVGTPYVDFYEDAVEAALKYTLENLI